MVWWILSFSAGSGTGRAASRRSRGGRPPFDHVFMFKVLILQASHSLSDERTEFLIKDRLSFMRFLGLGWPTRYRMRTRSGRFARRSRGAL